jgi:hypothetical protein
MVDYYGLPQHGESAWPGRAAASSAAPRRKPKIVEAALMRDIADAMGGGFDRNRFVAFVVMHEFEGLLFSDCGAFARGMGNLQLQGSLQDIRDQFDTPEDINDSPITAPSKRLKELMPRYEKPLFGNLAALEVGLDAIRAACPHFDSWLSQIEATAND